VLDDLLETLQRMQINPVEREAANRGLLEHRTVRAWPEEPRPDATSTDAEFISTFATQGEQETGSTQEPEYQLAEGDRAIIRYLDVELSRPEFYTMSNKVDDRINGHLLITSPLGQAIAHGSPGDELTFLEGGVDRSFLFVSLETESAQAA